MIFAMTKTQGANSRSTRGTKSILDEGEQAEYNSTNITEGEYVEKQQAAQRARAI